MSENQNNGIPVGRSSIRVEDMKFEDGGEVIEITLTAPLDPAIPNAAHVARDNICSIPGNGTIEARILLTRTAAKVLLTGLRAQLEGNPE